jgi:hypothetical protein
MANNGGTVNGLRSLTPLDPLKNNEILDKAEAANSGNTFQRNL